MTAKELYDGLMEQLQPHSAPELHDNVLIWPLYKDAYIQVICEADNTKVEIVSNSLLQGTLIHWYPEEGKLMGELCALGERGNLLVLKKSLFETGIFFLGPPEKFPLAEKQPFYFGKKRKDDFQLIYLEQK